MARPHSSAYWTLRCGLEIPAVPREFTFVDIVCFAWSSHHFSLQCSGPTPSHLVLLSSCSHHCRRVTRICHRFCKLELATCRTVVVVGESGLCKTQIKRRFWRLAVAKCRTVVAAGGSRMSEYHSGLVLEWSWDALLGWSLRGLGVVCCSCSGTLPEFLGKFWVRCVRFGLPCGYSLFGVSASQEKSMNRSE